MEDFSQDPFYIFDDNVASPPIPNVSNKLNVQPVPVDTPQGTQAAIVVVKGVPFYASLNTTLDAV